MAQPLRPRFAYTRIKENSTKIREERRKPNLRTKVYVGTWVGPGDPGNDPLATFSSPPFLNGFMSVVGKDIWFAHGLDGETDMGGAYDLITGSPVSGDVAFVMPVPWRGGMPDVVSFPVELETDVWTIAIQTHDITNGFVRIFWPIYATPIL